jgi:hypothetical protein
MPATARLAAIALVALSCATARPAPAPPLNVPVDQRYDRNALVTSVVAGPFVVALTAAGSLLRFERHTLALTGERWPARRAVALAAADDRGAVLVGLSSGHIMRLDPATLDMAPVGEVPGVPVFINRDPGSPRVVVVFGKPVAAPWGWSRRSLRDLRARSLDGAWEVPVDAPTTTLVDRQRRLWLGGDHGEWGGGIEVLDLPSGRLAEVPWEDGGGVYGFLERPDGEIWAFGGTAHMLMANGHVASVAPGRPSHVLYHHELMWGLTYEAQQKQQKLIGNRPLGPISHVMTVEGGQLLVVAGEHVFESDARFGRWKHVSRLEIGVPAGRPDAVANYPGVRSWAIVDGQLLLTTVRDGLVTLSPRVGALRAHRLDDQPSSPDVAICRERESSTPTYVEVGDRRVAASDVLPMERGQLLLALGSTVLKYDAATGRGSPLQIPGLDGEVHRLVRDERGRIWLAGRGLWLLDGFARAIDLRAAVPAAMDTDVCSLKSTGHRLSLESLDRGQTTVDEELLAAAALAGRLPAVAAEDRPRPFEPHLGDHAVFVAITPPVPWPKSQSWEQRFGKAAESVWAAFDRAGVRALPAEDGLEYRAPLIVYTDDSDAAIAVIERVMRTAALWDYLDVRQRRGGHHLPEVVVKSAAAR